jgi:SAM-dependent methyltransferase
VMKNLVVKLHRALFVFSPSMSLRMLRNRLVPRVSNGGQNTPAVHLIDHQYGIETSGFIGFEQLRSGKPSDIFNTAYCGSEPNVIRRALEMLPDHHNLTFFDLGCGKGRALAVASEFSFRRIVGIELVPFLASAARVNAEIMHRQCPRRTQIEVVENDASATPIPDGPLVIYLNHPFYRKMMKGVVKNIERWLQGSGTKAYVMYYNPVYFDLFDRSRLFSRIYAGMMDFEPHVPGAESAHRGAADALAIWQSIGEPVLQPHPQAAAQIQIEVAGWRAKVVWQAS